MLQGYKSKTHFDQIYTRSLWSPPSCRNSSIFHVYPYSLKKFRNSTTLSLGKRNGSYFASCDVLFFLHTANLTQSRSFSRFVAIKIYSVSRESVYVIIFHCSSKAVYVSTSSLLFAPLDRFILHCTPKVKLNMTSLLSTFQSGFTLL